MLIVGAGKDSDAGASELARVSKAELGEPRSYDGAGDGAGDGGGEAQSDEASEPGPAEAPEGKPIILEDLVNFHVSLTDG